VGAVQRYDQSYGDPGLRVVIFGLGSIGGRHARLLLERGGNEMVVFRSGPKSVQNSLGIKEVYDWREVAQFSPEISIISNPTEFHIQTAIKCAEMGSALFIEKPIGSVENGLDQLLEIVDKRKLTSYVAYNLRFHPVVQYLKANTPASGLQHYRSECVSRLPSWRPGIDHLEHYSSRRESGGGVVFELSHELDLAGYLLGDLGDLHGRSGRVGGVTIDAEDFADIQFESAAGVGSIHLNFFSHLNRRSIQMDYDLNSFYGDLIRNKVVKSENGVPIFCKDFSSERDTTYRHQFDYFFDNISNPAMDNNLIEASGLFRKILKFRNANTPYIDGLDPDNSI